MTSPGLIARKVKPSGSSAAAYSATSMFSAAFEIGYCGFLLNPDRTITSMSASPVESVTTFLIGPARRSGRKALIVCATPATFVRNCVE